MSVFIWYFDLMSLYIQNFQYKCPMRIFPTDKYLLKCKIGETALYEICTMEIETINHRFLGM